MTNSQGQSKPSDSTTVSNIALKRILTAAEQSKVLLEQKTILEERILNLQAQSKLEGDKDKVIAEAHSAEIKNLQKQLSDCDIQIKSLTRALKREKTKRVITGLIGMATTAGTAYIFTR